MPTLELVRDGELVASFRLDRPVVVAGRMDSCDITVKGPLVSRNHCQFVRSGDTYVIKDMGTANGTYVNGARVQEHTLRDGDQVAIVPHVLIYRFRDRKTPPETAIAMGKPAEGLATALIEAGEIKRHLNKLQEDAKPFGFTVTHEKIGDAIDLLAVSGALDAHTFEGLETAVNNLFVDGRYNIIIDMTKVNYLASAGAGVLVWAGGEAEENGGNLVLLSPTRAAQEVLDLGFAELFTIVQKRKDALAAFL